MKNNSSRTFFRIHISTLLWWGGLILSIFTEAVSGYYVVESNHTCELGKCKENEFCCHNNQCCKVYSNIVVILQRKVHWIVGVIEFVMVCTMISMWIYCVVKDIRKCRRERVEWRKAAEDI